MMKEFKLFKIEVRGQKIFADDIVFEILGVKHPTELYSKQTLRTLRTHLRNFMIIDYDLKMLTLGLEFYPSSLISMINWHVGTYVERRAEGVVTLRFNSVSMLRDAYYLIEEVFSGLEEHLTIVLAKGNIYFFGEGIVKVEEGQISFTKNPLFEVLDFIKFRRREQPEAKFFVSQLVADFGVLAGRTTERLFFGIVLMRVLANRSIFAHHFNAENFVTFKKADEEKVRKVLNVFKKFKQRYDDTSEENAYPVFSEIVKEVKHILYPVSEIERLIERTQRVIELLRRKSGRGVEPTRVTEPNR